MYKINFVCPDCNSPISVIKHDSCLKDKTFESSHIPVRIAVDFINDVLCCGICRKSFLVTVPLPVTVTAKLTLLTGDEEYA